MKYFLRLEGIALRRRLRAEHAERALEKSDKGLPLTKKEQNDLDWFINRVDDDKYEETGEVVLVPRKRVLTVEQIIAKRRREIEEAEKKKKREERKAERRRKLKADALAKAEKQKARIEAHQAKLAAVRQRNAEVAKQKIEAQIEREKTQKAEAEPGPSEEGN